jgi:hypothetical protein
MWTVRTDLVAAELCLLIGKRYKTMELKQNSDAKMIRGGGFQPANREAICG